jgi:BirA family transcriptional regulator, biotin operon repressor / biotin---[acetyl-CoA-carboxylase] ligase
VAIDIRTVAQTGSTNEDMKALAREGAGEGTWLRAERQTAGKGRMGRIWQGEEGNLFASTLVRLSPRDPSPASLAFVAAVAVHEVLTDFTGAGVLTIKWPNDILAEKKKLCGMLLERAEDAVIIGIGINIASAPQLPDRATTSLHALGARSADAASLLELLAVRFEEGVMRWRTYGAEPVIRLWVERAHPPGTPLAAELPDGERLSGIYEGLDSEGALILRLADGARRVIHAGDVFLT